MKIIKLFTVIFTSTLLFNSLYGQPQGKKFEMSPSPTVANLGIYGEIPVSYYTGIPNIQIPLAELNNNHINIPVGLSYHPAGIRPEIHPGPTGLGWSLQTGGVITRSIRYKADEYKHDMPGPNNGDYTYGYYYNTTILNKPSWKTYFTTKSCDEKYSAMLFKVNDLEPDEFSFSFLGMSGKFYLNSDGTFKVQSDRPLKVVFDKDNFIKPSELGINWPADYAKAFKRFTIIDEWGNKYIFGDDAIEFSCSIAPLSTENTNGVAETPFFANAWYLKEIVPADGSANTLFTYERGPIVAQLYRNYYTLSLGLYTNGGGWMAGASYAMSIPPNWNLGGSFIYPVYLRTINQGDGHITFNYSKSNELRYSVMAYSGYLYNYANEQVPEYELKDRFMNMSMMRDYSFYRDHLTNEQGYDKIEWRKLDEIKISSSYTDLKTIKFRYLENPAQRLFLEGIDINGDDNKTYQTYNLKYKDRDKLPSYDELLWLYGQKTTDHWGFYNGERKIGGDGGQIDRGIYSEFAHCGILNTIIYPTGGTTTFEFELNTAGKYVDNKDRTLIRNIQGEVGGFRIKRIKSEDLGGKSIIKDFFYNSNYLDNPQSDNSFSSGVLNALPNYKINKKDIPICNYRGYNYTAIDQEKSEPIIPLTNLNDGCYIGYTKVTEVTTDGTNINGYKQFTFSNHDNGYSDDQALTSNNVDAFWDIPHNSRYFERGRLLKEVVYDKNKKPITQTETTWNVLGNKSEDNNVKSLKFDAYPVTGFGPYTSSAYLNYIYKFSPTQKQTITYGSNNNNSTETINYNYNEQGLLTSELKTDSKKDKYQTTYSYPQDYFGNEVYVEMVKRNIIAPVIEQTLNLDYYAYSGKKEISKIQTNYNFWNNKAFIAPGLVKQSKGGNTLETEITYTQYDQKGNPLEYITKDGVTTTIVWGYNYSYPVAKVVGANLETVKNKININVFENLSVSDISKLKTIPNARISTYTYKSMFGVTSETDPNGNTTYYEYDKLGRLSCVKDSEQKIIKNIEYKYSN